uniref:NADH dehydrogenase subunit 2 n=1 Tax=Pilargis wolfi TaxID=3023926 RepID=UPI0030E5E1B3
MNSVFPYLPLFTSTLILGTIMSLSSNQWIYIWMGLEINLLSFIPIMISSSTNQETEGAIKYFLAQAMGSSMLLLGAINLLFSPLLFTGQKTSCLFILLGLMTKLGMAPCHFWFPSVMSSLPWLSCLILSTWQKIIPMLIIIFILSPLNNQAFMAPAALSGLVGGLGGLNQTQLRPLLAYSSIGHMGWMYAVSSLSSTTSITYLIVYMLIIASIMYIMIKLPSKSVKQLNSMTSLPTLILTPLMLTLLSLGGLPPLTGFFPKWISMECLMSNNAWLIAMILVIGSLMNLYYYLNVFFSMYLKSSTNYMPQPSYSTYSMQLMSMMTCWSLPLAMLLM